ncbi:MAG: PDZ domain-containing protein, partial [Candidatus Marinimicrobia bacterium]|nr:PDZ domain-containing protein [Candidatus Neomarinimicrobiota bacterium]
SGGALINLDGEVIGINSAILSRSGGSDGIGFAIPINIAKKVMNDIITEGRVIRAWLGITIQELNQDLSESLGLDNVYGVLISDVMIDSPADDAKLKSGDVIIKVNKDDVYTPSELQINISSRSPGDDVKLTIVRDGKTKIVSVSLEELPGEEPIIVKITSGTIDLGFTVQKNSEELARQYELNTQKGVVIVSVIPGSEIQRKGVRPGDRIITMERKTIQDLDDYNKMLKDIKKNQTLLMLIETKNGNKRFITIKAK